MHLATQLRIGPVDDLRVQLLTADSVGAEQGAIAETVEEPRHAAGEPVYEAQSPCGKERSSATCHR